MTPRSEEQNREIREQTRKAIMHTALELFAEEGYQTTTVSSIAGKAGVSKGLVYYHFESKEALLKAIVDQVLEADNEIMRQEAVSGLSPQKKLKDMIEAFFEMIRQDPKYWQLLMMLFFQPAVKEEYKQKLWKEFEQAMQYAEGLMKEMGWENAREHSMVLGAQFDGVTLHYLFNPDTYPLERIKDQIIKDYCGIDTE